MLVAFASSVLYDPELLTRLIAGSLQLSSEVIRPFPQRGPGEEITKLERKEQRLIKMCEEEAITIDELKRQRAAIREEIAGLRSVPGGSKEQSGPLT